VSVSVPPYKFGDFELDPSRFELLRNGKSVKLERIPMELLILLAEREGTVVSRQEIVQRLWGNDVFVDTEHGINTAIRKVRSALRDGAERPRFVQTVTGKGYRFVGEVANGGHKASEAKSWEPPSEEPAAIVPARKAERRLPVVAAVVAMVVIALAMFAVRQRLFGPSPQVQSIAVLPLVNLSGEGSQDYFADGMTDELITMMAKNSTLRVVSRTSVMQYKNARRPLREIAKELGADAILEGSLKRDGNRLHMTVQLIYAPTDTHLWANSYDRDGDQVSTLPSEVSLAVAARLKAESMTTAAQRYVNPEAHDAYLRGRYFWYATDFDRSREYMEKAVELQPDYATAWSGLADALAVLAVVGRVPSSQVRSPAEAASRKALELEPALPEAHNTAGAINLFFGWNWKVADAESSRAIALDPNLAELHHLRCYVLTALGRLDEAVQEQKKAADLAPFQHPFGMAVALVNARRYDAALEELRLRKEAQPGDVQIRSQLARVYRLKGMDKESAMETADLYALAGNAQAAAAVRDAFRRGGIKAVAQWNLSKMKADAKQHYVSPLLLARAYAQLQMKEETLASLEAAYDARAPFLVFLQSDPDLDFLHGEDRYRAIVRKMGLPRAY
jgi:TolB-like protein/DNA-binding winged helix-turn-helix (wHTH) protein